MTKKFSLFSDFWLVLSTILLIVVLFSGAIQISSWLVTAKSVSRVKDYKSVPPSIYTLLTVNLNHFNYLEQCDDCNAVEYTRKSQLCSLCGSVDSRQRYVTGKWDSVNKKWILRD